MYRTVIPHCTVTGPVDPVPYGHMGIQGAIPRKCGSCEHVFEGGCTRAGRQAKGYLALDHGPCPVKGPTHPVLLHTQYYQSTVFVPAKCAHCRHRELDRLYGFVCTIDKARWGEFSRTLDWGAWQPDHPNLGLRSGRSLTVEMLEAIAARDEVRWIKIFRATHQDAIIREARDAYAELVGKLAGTADESD